MINFFLFCSILYHTYCIIYNNYLFQEQIQKPKKHIIILMGVLLDALLVITLVTIEWCYVDCAEKTGSQNMHFEGHRQAHWKASPCTTPQVINIGPEDHWVHWLEINLGLKYYCL